MLYFELWLITGGLIMEEKFYMNEQLKELREDIALEETIQRLMSVK